MITVHHLNNSRSRRVLWLLEELGVPYEVKRHERNHATMLAAAELRAVHFVRPQRETAKAFDFLRRAQARPAYKRVLERGGPYELLR